MAKKTESVPVVISINGTEIQTTISKLAADYLSRQISSGISMSKELNRYLEDAIVGAMDTKYKPPTKLQISAAKKIAAEYGVSVPVEALENRSVMSQWIGEHQGRANG